MENPDQPHHGYYAVIPAIVLDDDRLTSTEKLLYGRITALTTQQGYCYARNSYLAELTKTTETSIRRSVSKLVEYGYLEREVIVDPETKEVKARHLYLPGNPVRALQTKSSVPLQTKSSVALQTKMSAAPDENVWYKGKYKKEEVNTSSEIEKTQPALIPDPPNPEPTPTKEVKVKTVKTTVDPKFKPPQETIDEMKRMYPQQLTRDILTVEHANFIDHYTATGDKCVEGGGWIAAWKKWMRRVAEREKKNIPPAWKINGIEDAQKFYGYNPDTWPAEVKARMEEIYN
jgi:hypothetical protein